MSETHVRAQRGLSIWPFILIGVGVIWLLAEANVISWANVSVLFRLWPVILIAIGLELLIGRSSRALSTLIGLATVVLLLVLMFIGPSLGLAQTSDIESAEYNATLEGADSARVELSAAVSELFIAPLEDSSSDTLIDADLRYLGTVSFDERIEDGQRIVTIDNEHNSGFNLFSSLEWLITDRDLRWDVGLNPDVPLELVVNTGTGATNLDLSDFNLSSLHINTGTGSITADLPNMENRYDVRAQTGTGSIEVAIPEGAALTLRLSTGTGGATVDVPDDAAVRLEGSTGTGGITVPGGWQQISGSDDDNFLGNSGVWESPNFGDDTRQIIINYDGGTGGLTVR